MVKRVLNLPRINAKTVISVLNGWFFVKKDKEVGVMSDISMKLAVLETMYKIHDRILASYDLACAEGCSVCCTRNVSVTSLEAFFMLDNLDPDKRDNALARIQGQMDKKRLIPAITINRMADLCMNGYDLPEEECDPAWGACPLLEDGRCTVYSVRPFGCRCMVSSENCGLSGLADMDEFLVTVNNVFMQYLEHIDQGSTSANISDMLLALSDPHALSAYRITGLFEINTPGFLSNQPISILMVPPEYRERINDILSEL